MKIRVIEEIYAPLLINAAQFTPVIHCPEAFTVAYVIGSTGAAAPVGTTLVVQGSIDGVNFADCGVSQTIAGNGVQGVFAANANYRYYRLAYGWVSGSYTATTAVLARGET